MPKISSNKLYIKGEGGELIDFIRVIKYDPKGKAFIANLPDHWAKTLGQKEVGSDTQDHLEIEWQKAQEKFDELTTNKRKVIFYKFASSAFVGVCNDGRIVGSHYYEEHDNFNHCLFRTSGHGQQHSMSFTEGTALDIWFTVGYVTTSKFEKYDIYVDLDGRRIGDDRLHASNDIKFIDWTSERERFFQSFDVELNLMIFKLSTYLNGDTKQMALLIDQCKNVNALPSPQLVKTQDSVEREVQP